MSDWVERARRRLGLEEIDPDDFPPFGEDEAKDFFFQTRAGGFDSDKTSATPSSSAIDGEDSSPHAVTKLTKLTKPLSSSSIGRSYDVEWFCEPEKTAHPENRTDKTDKTPEEIDSSPPDAVTKLTKLTKPRQEDHQALLGEAALARPPDVKTADWDAAMRGLSAFLRGGHGAEAERLGWPSDELYRVPELWSQIHLAGCALLIGDREVVDITAAEIRIKTASGSTLAFRRKPEVDYRLVYETRLKLIRGNYPSDSEEPGLRALEYTVRLCREHRNCDLETAKAAVLSALKRSVEERQ
jgi:hypothetical protein